VIISASGMCEGGRVLHHLRHNIEDARATILIASYQAAETLGRRIVERVSPVRILGRSLELKAEVAVLNGLSSHADHPGIVAALAPLRGITKQVRLVHGEPERAELLVEALRGDFEDVQIPDRGEQIVLGVV
jgi:metallo-beta-lactamase family protein